MYQDSRGNGGLTLNKNHSKFGYKINIPCKKCIGCRLDYSREWAIRCHHESITSPENSFITLTYSDDHLPKNSTLVREHFQKFIRALRQRTGKKIRYYMCGEYGEKTQRPHYHALLFGYDFPDKTLHRTQRGNKIYRSQELEKTWIFGYSEIGQVTFKTAAYTARYIMKKQYGDQADTHYGLSIDIKTRKKTYRTLPEFTNCSLKPGIGYDFYKKFFSDLFPRDHVRMPNNKILPMPTYYRTLLERDNPAMAEKLKLIRIEKARGNLNLKYQGGKKTRRQIILDNEKSPKRLAVKEKCHELKAKQLKREL